MPCHEECTTAPAVTVSRYRLSLVREAEESWPVPPRCRWPSDAVPALFDLVHDEPREVVGALFLDIQDHIIGYTLAYYGILHQVLAEPRGLLLPALLANAASIILFHNHPNGDVTPSGLDLRFTRRIQEAGSLLGVSVREHIILGDPPSFHAIYQSVPSRRPVPKMRPGRKAKPKYRHPVTGETWAGRGCMARWLREAIEAGATLDDFRV